MLSTGSEQQGQNSISDPDQNLGFTCTCIFSSGMQEHSNLHDCITCSKTLFYLNKALSKTKKKFLYTFRIFYFVITKILSHFSSIRNKFSKTRDAK